MSKYPCGICVSGVKYQGIYCTGPCKTWYHSKCLKWSDKKFKILKKEEINTWMCDKCKTNKTFTEIEKIESKIHDLSHNGTLDHDTSLALAAEVGNALLNENKVLKQKLHETKLNNVDHVLTLEDKLVDAEITIKELNEANKKLSLEITLISSKLEKERNYKDEIIEDAENEKLYFSKQLNDLSSCNSKLRNKIQNLEADIHEKSQNIETLEMANDILLSDLKQTKAELDVKTTLINKINCNCEELARKLSEQETITRTYLNSLLKDTKSYLTSMTPTTEENNHENRINQSINSLNNSTTNMTNEPLTLDNKKIASPPKMPLDKTTLNTSKNIDETDKRSTGKEGKSMATTRTPPLSAKILRNGETFEAFFERELENFKKCEGNQHPTNSSKSTPEIEDRTPTSTTKNQEDDKRTKTSMAESNTQTKTWTFLEARQKTKHRQKRNYNTKIFLNTSLKSMKTRRQKEKNSTTTRT